MQLRHIAAVLCSSLLQHCSSTSSSSTAENPYSHTHNMVVFHAGLVIRHLPSLTMPVVGVVTFTSGMPLG